MSEATRRKVYDMLVADKMRVQGFHYPFPAIGNVEKDGTGTGWCRLPWRSRVVEPVGPDLTVMEGRPGNGAASRILA